MSSDVDLKTIEQRTFGDAQQDGLLELVLGLCLAGFSMRALSPACAGGHCRSVPEKLPRSPVPRVGH